MRPLLLFLFCSGLLSAQTSVAPPGPLLAASQDLAQRILAFQNPVLDPARQVEKVHIALDHCNLVLSKGRVSVVRIGGQPAGLFFVGEGAIQYLSQDPVEIPAQRFNLAQRSRLKPRATEDGTMLEDRLQQAFLLFGGFPLPAIEGPAAADLNEPFQAHQATFARHRGLPAAHAFLAREFNTPGRKLLVAELSGALEKYLYKYDMALEQVESLALLQTEHGPDGPYLLSVPLSEQTLHWNRKEPLLPAFSITAVDLDIQASKGTFAKIQADELLLPHRPNQRVFLLDQQSFLHRRHLAGASRQNLRVVSVRDEQGQPLPFDHRDHSLMVCLPRAAEAGKPLKLRFELEGDFLVSHRGDQYWELGVFPWFPQTGLAGMAYTVNCRIALEKPYVPLAPGIVLKRESTRTHNLLEVRIDRPVCFFSIAGGKYEIREHKDPTTGVTVQVCGYSGLSVHAERLAKTAHGMIRFYSALLGPLPFDNLLLIERRELGHGQAPPGMVFITKEAFNPKEDEESSWFAWAWINQGLAHEIAHQYWGHLVKMNSSEDQWITEAFSEYSSGLAMKQTRSGKDRYERIRRRWEDDAKAAKHAAPISHANWLRPKRDAVVEHRYRQQLIYSKGALLLEALHGELGDDLFHAFLRNYLQAFAWKPSCTQDIPDLLKQMTQKDWNPWFDRYYWGLEVPPAPGVALTQAGSSFTGVKPKEFP